MALDFILGIDRPRWESPISFRNPFSGVDNALARVVQIAAFSALACLVVALCVDPIISFLAVPYLIPGGIPLAIVAIWLMSRSRRVRDDDDDYYRSPRGFASAGVYHEPYYPPHHDSLRVPGTGARTFFEGASYGGAARGQAERKGEFHEEKRNWRAPTDGGRAHQGGFSSSGPVGERIGSGGARTSFGGGFSQSGPLERIAGAGGRTSFGGSGFSESGSGAARIGSGGARTDLSGGSFSGVGRIGTNGART